jgi:hypothetical protein
MLEHEGQARLHNICAAKLGDYRDSCISRATRSEYHQGVLMNEWRAAKKKRYFEFRCPKNFKPINFPPDFNFGDLLG